MARIALRFKTVILL